VMESTLTRWLQMAAERLDGACTRLYVMLGNDDEPALRKILAASPVVVDPEDVTVDLGEGIQTMSCGFATYAIEVVMSAERLLKTADLVEAATLQAMKGHLGAFFERAIEIRPFPGALEVAANIRDLCDVWGSQSPSSSISHSQKVTEQCTARTGLRSAAVVMLYSLIRFVLDVIARSHSNEA
jgi:hypothetical protein